MASGQKALTTLLHCTNLALNYTSANLGHAIKMNFQDVLKREKKMQHISPQKLEMSKEMNQN